MPTITLDEKKLQEQRDAETAAAIDEARYATERHVKAFIDAMFNVARAYAPSHVSPSMMRGIPYVDPQRPEILALAAQIYRDEVNRYYASRDRSGS